MNSWRPDALGARRSIVGDCPWHRYCAVCWTSFRVIRNKDPYITPAVLAGGNTNGLALDLYLAYPKYSDVDARQTDATGRFRRSIALAKVTYTQLILSTRRFAAIQNRPGQDRIKTPPLVTWFDEEQWRNIPNH
ncbi:MAG: hypothetical protein JWM11_234 [Planctomycetaceae bacterium]|nr:hypothetical protein [Planctomycetaceae bacterium]